MSREYVMNGGQMETGAGSVFIIVDLASKHPKGARQFSKLYTGKSLGDHQAGMNCNRQGE